MTDPATNLDGQQGVAAEGGAQLGALQAELARTRAELLVCRHQGDFCTAALRAIGDAVVTVDLNGRIVFMNPVASHLTGWRESETVGHAFSEMVRFADARGNIIDVLSPTSRMSSLKRRDAHVVMVEGTATPLLDSQERKLGFVVIFRNVTAARRLTDELKYHANHDPLTGMKNRRSFESQLRRAVVNAGEQRCNHSLIYIDLDHFKAVNDGGGHLAGDALLRQLSVLLRRQLRDHDTLARLGGDEFAMLLEDCLPAQAAHVAEKVRSTVEGFGFEWQGQVFNIGASVGQVHFSDDSASALDLLMRADQMCYRAKNKGRNRVEVYAPRERGKGRRQSPQPQSEMMSGRGS